MLKLLSASTISACVLAFSGCASFNNVNSEVSTYGPWPADRKPASFVFERLPSQAAHPEREQMLENAARGAVEAAGFRAAEDGPNAEYLMQVGARVSSTEPWMYNDPLFWRGHFRYAYPYGYARYGRPFGPPWVPLYDDFNTFDREVALLIRDRKSGQLLYEARANNSGPSADIGYLLPAMFAAAMKDFPGVGPNPRSVTTPITKQ